MAEREGGISESLPEPDLLSSSAGGKDGTEEEEEVEEEELEVEMQPMQLLLVEEDPVTLKEVGDMLRFTGHHVTKTGFGPQLLRVMCETQWDGMLIGCGKANGYGWDLLKGYRMWQQRQDEASSDICLLIPQGDVVAQQCAERWGAGAYEKPLSVSALMGACRHLFNAKLPKPSSSITDSTQGPPSLISSASNPASSTERSTAYRTQGGGHARHCNLQHTWILGGRGFCSPRKRRIPPVIQLQLLGGNAE